MKIYNPPSPPFRKGGMGGFETLFSEHHQGNVAVFADKIEGL
jgi:hypothetical protein